MQSMAGTRLGVVVVKVGTAVITNKDGTLNSSRIEDIVAQIAKNRGKARAFVVVTSGAIAGGITKLGLISTPQELPLTMKQVCASVGQPWLMSTYDKYFMRYGMTSAQILLTEEDLANKYSYSNFWRTLKTLLRMNVVPVINENDAISVRELVPVNPYVPDIVRFGDNDKLSALIASKVRASLLIILTNVEGFYSQNEKGRPKLVTEIKKVGKGLIDYAKGPDRLGRGGMSSKLEAAKIASRSGVTTVIASGFKRSVIRKALEGHPLGTVVLPNVRSKRK